MADTYGSYEDTIPLETGEWSFIPGGAITKGSPVKPSADGSDIAGIKVVEAGADEPHIGYAMEAATGDGDPKTIRVQTRFRAVVKATAAAAITRGDPVVAAGSDKVKTATKTSTWAAVYASFGRICGVALQSPAADGDTFAVGLF